MMLATSLFAAVDPNKIGIVNFDIAFRDEHEAQKLTKDLEKEEQEILDTEQKASMEIEKKVAEFQKNMPKLSDKAKMDQQTTLSNEYNNLRQQFAERRVNVNKKRQEGVANLENKNRAKIESIARKENYSLVLNSAAVIYASDEVKKNDITSKLVTEYNKEYPVKAEAPKKGKGKGDEAKPAPRKRN